VVGVGAGAAVAAQQEAVAAEAAGSADLNQEFAQQYF